MGFTSGLQFDRHIEVEVKNFSTGEKITIGNDLKISFDFYKTIDEVNEASLGKIKIYGLTESTRKKLGGAGGEVTLKTGYTNAEVIVLFTADIVNIYPEYNPSNPCVVIDVSANFMNYAFTKTAADSNAITIVERARNLATSMNRSFEFWVANIPDQDRDKVIEWIQTRRSRTADTGLTKKSLDLFCSEYGFSFFLIDPINSGGQVQVVVSSPMVNGAGNESAGITPTTLPRDSTIRFFIPDNKIHIITEWANDSYDKVTRTISQSDIQSEQQFKNIFVADESESVQSAVVLTRDTGLLGYPRLESKIVDVPESWAISGSEQAVQESLNAVAEKKQKIADKAKQRELAGKNPLKTKPKSYRIKVKRKFITVKAQLNPTVRPQSHVKIISIIEEATGVYRVRNVRFVGDNRDGEYTMELNCEDSGGKYDKLPSKQELDKERETNTEANLSGSSDTTVNLGSGNVENVEGSSDGGDE